MTRDERMKEIEEREKNATAGPWEQQGRNCGEVPGVYATLGPGKHYLGNRFIALCRYDRRNPDIRQSKLNAEFIAHARTDIPFLLSEVKRLEVLHENTLAAGNTWRDEALQRRTEKSNVEALQSKLDRAVTALGRIAINQCRDTHRETNIGWLMNEAREALAEIGEIGECEHDWEATESAKVRICAKCGTKDMYL